MTKAKKTDEKPTTRGITVTVEITGTAEVELEDVVGDRELRDGDEDEVRRKLEETIEGAELHSIEVDDLCLTVRTHLA
jgi:hypothetical protein